jgi:hypothetical protein
MAVQDELSGPEGKVEVRDVDTYWGWKNHNQGGFVWDLCRYRERGEEERQWSAVCKLLLFSALLFAFLFCLVR